LRLIYKFGGKSLASVDKIQKVSNFIKKTIDRKDVELIVVVSAMGNTTNKLERLANSINPNNCLTDYSSLVTIGENISAYALSLALNAIGVNSVALSAKDIKIHSQGCPTNSLITHIDKQKIEKFLNENKVVIITGFQGVNNNDETLSLGRGGSDTTAVALGNIFDAPVKIWTDIDGFYTTDPNKYKTSRKNKSINIYSAIELANAGTKILDLRCLNLSNCKKTNLSVGNQEDNSPTKVTYTPIEHFQIDGLCVKNDLSFVINTSKNKEIIQLMNNKIFYYEKIKISKKELLVTILKKNILNYILSQNKFINYTILNCNLLILTGSALLSQRDFREKLQNVINKHKINYYHMHLSETKLILITKNYKSNKIENIFISEFDLNKEN